jgi:hypothetical protein
MQASASEYEFIVGLIDRRDAKRLYEELEGEYGSQSDESEAIRRNTVCTTTLSTYSSIIANDQIAKYPVLTLPT